MKAKEPAKRKTPKNEKRHITLIIILSIMLTITSIQLVRMTNRANQYAKERNTAQEQIARKAYDWYAQEKIINVCQQSRLSPSITEEQCADLQDKFNMEFICLESNALPSNKCWVEPISGVRVD